MADSADRSDMLERHKIVVALIEVNSQQLRCDSAAAGLDIELYGMGVAVGDYDNDAGYTGGNVNKSSESWTINTWYTPLPKLDIGAEFRHAVRELENGKDGSLDRLQFTTRYSF